MKKMVFIILMLIIAASGSLTAISASVDIPIVHKVLPNGLNIYLSRVKYIPAVTVAVYYNVGSKDERDNERGLSHFLEHMMFKTTKTLKAGEYSTIIKANGGYNNASTSFDMTNYYNVLPRQALELGLRLEADRMVNLTIDKREFDSEKLVVLEELRNRSENDPAGYFWTQFILSAYKVSNYGKPIIGKKEQVEGLTIETMKQYYRRFYAPNNAHLVVVGDIDYDEAYKYIVKYFGNIERQNIDRPEWQEEPERTQEQRFVFKKAVQLPRGTIYYHGPRAMDLDSAAMEMIEFILFDGRSSRLIRKLVLETGLAVNVGGGQYLNIHRSPFSISFIARKKELLPLIEKAVIEELEKFKSGKVSDYEMQKAKNKFLSQHIMGLQKIHSIAATIGRGAILGDYKFYLETRTKRILAVTKEDIMRVAKKYFTLENRSVGYLISE